MNPSDIMREIDDLLVTAPSTEQIKRSISNSRQYGSRGSSFQNTQSVVHQTPVAKQMGQSSVIAQESMRNDQSTINNPTQMVVSPSINDPDIQYQSLPLPPQPQLQYKQSVPSSRTSYAPSERPAQQSQYANYSTNEQRKQSAISSTRPSYYSNYQASNARQAQQIDDIPVVDTFQNETYVSAISDHMNNTTAGAKKYAIKRSLEEMRHILEQPLLTFEEVEKIVGNCFKQVLGK